MNCGVEGGNEPMDSIQKKCKKMNKIFKKSRSVSPSFEIPKICLPRQNECVDDGYDLDMSMTLKVPTESRGRSSSFDSSSLQRQETLPHEFLEVPTKQGRRCHSFDSACTLQMNQTASEESINDSGSSNWSLKVPKNMSRRHSLDIPKLCIHCIHMEAKAKEKQEREEALQLYHGGNPGPDDSDNVSFTSSTTYSSTTPDSTSDLAGFYYLSDSEDEGNESDCEDNIDSPNYRNNKCEAFDNYKNHLQLEGRCNIDSSISPSSEKCCILDMLNGHNLKHIDSKDEEDLENVIDDNDQDEDDVDDDDDDDDEDYINAVTLEVPILKQRSSSMDACFMNTKDCAKNSPKQVQRQKSFDNGDMLDVPIQVRSSSVDVNLPTEQEQHYKAIPYSDSR